MNFLKQIQKKAKKIQKILNLPKFINKSKKFPERKKKMQSQIGDILHQQEIKQLIKKLIEIHIKDYGTLVWFKQDEALQKLNMQLHVNAIMKNDEYILQQLVVQDKFKLMIYDLIVTSTWKQKVLPLIKQQVAQMNSLKVYLALYHQAVILNILQVLMFHRTAIDESGQFLIEVIDYCYKKITRQIAKSIKQKKQREEEFRLTQKMTDQEKKKRKMEQIIKRTPVQQLQKQIQQIEFSLFIMSISIFRYVTDYIRHLQIGVIHHIVVESNIYSVLVPLIEERPWLRTNQKGERQIFENNRWNLIPKSQYGRLPKTEAQVWIALYNLFMDPQCRKKYQLNDERKNTLLRLRKYMNEVLLDQIPNLSAMLRSLEQLSMMNVPTHLTSNPFVVQQVPVILSNISAGINWKELAQQQKQRLKQSMDQTEKQHMQNLAELYSNNSVQGLLQGFKCGKCGKQAFKRCSKCKSVWYCTRECQVGHWPEHKAKCNARAKQMKEMQEKKKSQPVNQQPIQQPKVLIDELD